MPKQGNAFLIPSVLTPEGRRCVVLYIPDEQQHIANFWGALLPLSQWLHWERDDDKSGKVLAKLWKTVIYDAWDRFETGDCLPDCPECPECPEEPEPEKPPKPIIGGGGVENVGRLGLTMDELEEYFMSFSLRGLLAYVDGRLCYWGGDCCGWIPIANEDGTIPAPVSGATTQAAGSMTLSEWVAAGKPAVNGLKPGSHSNPDYSTEDSVKCAKATVLVNTMRDSTGDIWGAMLAAAGGGAAGAALIAGALMTISFPVAVATAVAFVIISVVSGYGWYTVLDGLEALKEDDTIWDAMLCAMVPEMTAGTAIEGVDIETLFYWLRDKAEITPESYEYRILHSLPMSYWIEKAQFQVVDAECGCETYLPFGYVPPVSTGVVSYYKNMVETSNGANTQTKDISTTGYAAYNQSPPHGTKVGGNKFRSTFIGAAGGQYYQAIGLLVEFQDNFDLSNIKWEHSSHGTTYYDYNAELYVWKPLSNTWQEINTGTPSGESGTVTQSVGTIEDVKQAVIWMKAAFSNSSGYFEIDNVRFTGLHNGIGFIELPLGQPLP